MEGRAAVAGWLGRLRFIGVGGVIAGVGGVARRLLWGDALGMGGEQDLPRSSLALIANQRTLYPEPCKSLAARREPAGAINTKDALVGAQAIHFCSGGGGNIVQDLA